MNPQKPGKARTIALGSATSLLFASLLQSCGGGGPESGPLIATRDTLGDTVVVRVASGSLWERPLRLREDLRIGSLYEEGPQSFGSIVDVAVGSDGELLVFDRQVPALRRFSSSGEFLGNIGRDGQGPGEYSARPTGLMVDRDGRVILSDPSNARISAYSGDGRFLASLGHVSGYRSLFGRMIAGDDSGRIYVPVVMVGSGPGMPTPVPWPIGIEVRDSDGTVTDTFPPASIDGGRAGVVGIHPDGSMVVVGANRTVFEIRSFGKGVVRVELPYQRVPYTETERARLGIALQPVAAADGTDEVALPEAKRAYIDIFFDPSGRIWLRRPIEPASAGDPTVIPRFQPSVLDAFQRNGTYLGVVKLPARTRPVAVTETHLYVVQLGEYDEEYVVRYRLGL